MGIQPLGGGQDVGGGTVAVGEDVGVSAMKAVCCPVGELIIRICSGVGVDVGLSGT